MAGSYCRSCAAPARKRTRRCSCSVSTHSRRAHRALSHNGRGLDHDHTAGLIAELVRILGAAGELARILVVEADKDKALLVGEAFSGEHVTVRMARNREQAMDECLAFQPHLLVLNVAMPESDGYNLVDWLREQEMLFRMVVVVYAGHSFAPTGSSRFGMEPTTLLKQAPVQPQQLEQLLLTILRGSHQLDPEEETYRCLRGTWALAGRVNCYDSPLRLLPRFRTNRNGPARLS